jgi:hypothetical protein
MQKWQPHVPIAWDRGANMWRRLIDKLTFLIWIDNAKSRWFVIGEQMRDGVKFVNGVLTFLTWYMLYANRSLKAKQTNKQA